MTAFRHGLLNSRSGLGQSRGIVFRRQVFGEDSQGQLAIELLAERALNQIVFPLDLAHGRPKPGGVSSGMICRRLRR
jgi:hypothetical protein